MLDIATLKLIAGTYQGRVDGEDERGWINITFPNVYRAASFEHELTESGDDEVPPMLAWCFISARQKPITRFGQPVTLDVKINAQYDEYWSNLR